MTQSKTTIFADALRLPETERGELAVQLLDSLDPDTENETDQAWAQEIQTRLSDIRSGRVVPVPWPEARRQILADIDHAD